MLLRVRVVLPDRPGSLGVVAHALGVAGADIVQVVVLERLAGRAVDDFTLSWPTGSAPERLGTELAAVPGVDVLGLWRTTGAPLAGGCDAELLGQLAANPGEGLAILVDAVPGLLAADWAAALLVPADWARHPGGEPPIVAYPSWHAPDPVPTPDVLPLRARAMTGEDGTRYAAVPFGRAGLVLLVGRRGATGSSAGAGEPGGAGAPGGAAQPDDAGAPGRAAQPGGVAQSGGVGEPGGAEFHSTELDRLSQLVRAATGILGDRLDPAATVSHGPAATASRGPAGRGLATREVRA